MLTFTVDEKGISQHIALQRVPTPHVALGSLGYLGVLSCFPVSEELSASVGKSNQITQAYVSKPFANVPPMLDLKPNPLELLSRRGHPVFGEDQAIVHLKIDSGERNSTYISGRAFKPLDFCDSRKKFNPSSESSICRHCYQTRSQQFSQYKWDFCPATGITVLASGNAAGSQDKLPARGYNELLLVLEPGCQLTISCHGRIIPAETFVLSWTGQEMRLISYTQTLAEIEPGAGIALALAGLGFTEQEIARWMKTEAAA